MSVVLRLCAIAPALLAGAAPSAAAQRTQYVIISFDGAHDVAQWKRSRAIATKTGAKFTYFLSCVFLLSPETVALPSTWLGFRQIQCRVRSDQARSYRTSRRDLDSAGEGHEIASHACGHFDGARWSKADWLREFTMFTTILRDAYLINGIAGEPEGWQHFATEEIKGFRAPYLSTGKVFIRRLPKQGSPMTRAGYRAGPPNRQSELDGEVCPAANLRGSRFTPRDRDGLQSVRSPFRRV